MDFGLSDEQLMMQDTVRALLENECPPSHVREGLTADTHHDPALWSLLAEMGLPGLIVPEQYGGSGFELLDAALVAEVAGEGALPGPLLGHQLATLAVLHGGDESQRQKWLPALASGESVGTVAWAEPGNVWKPADWAASVADGSLSGVKAHVLHASHADVIVVGTAGGQLAVAERPADGIDIAPFDGIDRTRRIDTVTFAGTPAEVLTNGEAATGIVRDAALVLLTADAFGCAHRLVRETVDYLNEREQFDTKLTQFQGVKHELANMVTGLEPSRALWWYAAHALDNELDDAARTTAIAKAHVCDRATEIARACVDLQGAMGYTWESTVHVWYKRIMFDRAFFDGPSEQRTRAADLGGW